MAGDHTSPAEVERIVAMEDQPILRNLLITQTYADLSNDLANLLGRENLNWCTYACWASRTAGRFICKEEVPRAFLSVLQSTRRLTSRAQKADQALAGLGAGTRPASLLEAIEAILSDVTDYITLGNKIVFAELGLVFSKFVRAFSGVKAPDRERLQSLLAEISDGPTFPDKVERRSEGGRTQLVASQRGGQRLLRQSMTCYHDALFEPDPRRKAELILFANALGGLHEQTRLQTYIERSAVAPIAQLLAGRAEESFAERLAREQLGTWRVVAKRAVAPFADGVERAWQRFSTEQLMTMPLPNGTLRLGRDVPSAPGAALFPRELARPELPELVRVLKQYKAYRASGSGFGLGGALTRLVQGLLGMLGVAPGSMAGTAARNWCRMENRMRFIFVYFRSRQQDRALFGAPFSPEQETSIRAGRVPAGALG